MEVEGEKPSSLPSNYVTIHQLKERWLQQQQQKSPSKPEPENPKPKPKPNENAIKPTNTQNQRPNFGRVTNEHKHKLKEVKMDDNGSTSKTLVVDDMKNPYKNDAAKHNQRPNFGRLTNEHKLKEVKVDDNGSTSQTLVDDDMKNPKPKPNENAIKPTNTQNQRPNFGRVTNEHKLKEVKVDDNGSTSKTLVVDDMKNPYKNDAAKHNQRPNYRPVANQPKPKVDDDGSASKIKTLVADDLRSPKIRPMADDDGLSTKALVVGVTDNKLNGENESGDSKFNLKKKKKRNKKLRKPKVVTDQNPTGAEPEPGAKVVEGEMEKKSYPANQNPVGAELKPETEVEVVDEKGKERRRYGHRNGNLRFGAESERKTEPEQEAEVVEEKMKKKNYGRGKPADRNPNGAELKSEMVEEVVMEKWKRGLGYGRRNGNSRAVLEQKETAPVDGNNGGGGDGVVEEVVKERNVGQGRNRNGDYRRDKKRVLNGSFGEQQRLIWVKKGESVVPN